MLKFGGGVLALALIQSWGQLLSRRLVIITAWRVSLLLVFHESNFIIQGSLTENGLIGLPTPAAWTTAHWQTFVWGPWWLLGGLAFCVATWTYQRRSR